MERGCWLLVAGYWLLVTGYWLLVAGYWLPVKGTHPLAPSLDQGGGMSTGDTSEQSPSLVEGGVGVGTTGNHHVISFLVSISTTTNAKSAMADNVRMNWALRNILFRARNDSSSPMIMAKTA
jgi:hypothetical protein